MPRGVTLAFCPYANIIPAYDLRAASVFYCLLSCAVMVGRAGSVFLLFLHYSPAFLFGWRLPFSLLGHWKREYVAELPSGAGRMARAGGGTGADGWLPAHYHSYRVRLARTIAATRLRRAYTRTRQHENRLALATGVVRAFSTSSSSLYMTAIPTVSPPLPAAVGCRRTDACPPSSIPARTDVSHTLYRLLHYLAPLACLSRGTLVDCSCCRAGVLACRA